MKDKSFKRGFVPFRSKTEILARAKIGTIPKEGMVISMKKLCLLVIFVLLSSYTASAAVTFSEDFEGSINSRWTTLYGDAALTNSKALTGDQSLGESGNVKLELSYTGLQVSVVVAYIYDGGESLGYNIYVNPTFLPEQMMPEYDELWTICNWQVIVCGYPK